MFVSESKTATQQIADTISKSLAIVELDPKDADAMDKMYVAKNKKHFETLGVFTAQTVGRLTQAYNFIANLVRYADHYEDIIDTDPDQFIRRLQGSLDVIHLRLGRIDGKLDRSAKASLSASFGATSGIIIRASKRYEKGMDIIHTGTPAAESPLAGAGNFNFFNSTPENRLMTTFGEAYEDDVATYYSTELSQGIFRASEQLQLAIFGSARTKDNVFEPIPVNIPLDFNWEALNAILYAIHPLFKRLDIQIFKNLDKAVARELGDFMSIALRRVPLPSQIQMFRNTLRYHKDEDPIDVYNKETLSLNVGFEGGLVVSLRPSIVEYISQGSDKKIMSLFRWYQAWGSFNLRVTGSAKGSIRKMGDVPRYVTSATKLPDLKKLRENFNYAVTEQDADANGLTLMPNGVPAVLPNRDDVDLEIVKDYEQTLEEIQQELYSKGIPLSVSHETLRTGYFQCMSKDLDFDAKVQEKPKTLSRFSNVCIGSDPDFNTIIVTDSSGLNIRGVRTVGAKRPQVLDLADSLGYDFANAGEAPNFRTATRFLFDMWESTSATATYRGATDLMLKAGQYESGVGKFVESCNGRSIKFEQGYSAEPLYRLISEICASYGFFAGNGRVPLPAQLVKEGMASLGMEGSESIVSSDYDNGLYENLIDNDGTPHVYQNDNGMWLLRVMTRVLNDAAGLRGSNLMSVLIRDTGSLGGALEGAENSTHYFSIRGSKLSDMARLSNYLGGTIFNIVCGAIAGIDRKVMYSDISRDPNAPPALIMQQHILPLSVMVNKVIPNSLEIFESAEDAQERTKIDTSITAEDIKIPGLAPNVSLMPHQLAVHQTLRKRPRYAVLFISPGGGKTILGLTDIGALTQDLKEVGEKTIRPLVVCPTNLVATWADDCRKFMPSWNVVPITSDTVNSWGEERMYEVLNSAPPNTIFVAGLSFLSTGSFNVDIGGVRVQIRGAVEFVNRFNFSYVLLDESHKVKNYQGGQQGSQVHFNTKLIFTAPSVRYARLATGTFVTDRVTDVVGQAALLSPSIFGDSLDIVDGQDGTLAMINRTHSRMTNHTAFISMKRKEWAFMLPNPIDTFLQVRIDDPTVPHSDLHLETYKAMYSEVLEELEEAAKSAKRTVNEDDEDSGDESTSEVNEDELEDGDVLGKLMASNANLNMYFQRMEMMLTDPMGDDVARLTFEAAGVKEFVSSKVLTIIERIKKHFEVQQDRDPDVREQQIFMWRPGVTPRELDIAIYDGKKYLARKQSDGFVRADLPPSMVSPDKDLDYWKEERSGKLIVFTRYTRSANAIYNALPDEYKRIALLYHGEVSKLGQNKDANLDAFKTDDRYQIIIANEQAISEGHNLQMGSRIIRCDTPWSPGTYEQSTSRIFRPDVSTADLDESGKPGDMAREVVFVDWVMTGGTLEVGKVARLMWKTLEKTQFDEKGNPRYEPLNRYQLERIPMSASLLLESNTIEDFMQYFEAKRELNEIESQEFAEMRKTTVARMIPLTPVPPMSDFKVLDSVPFVANQKIPDRHNWGLERLIDWCREKGFSQGDQLKTALHRKPVVTEFGNGIIVGMIVRNVDGQLREDSPISTVRVRLAGTEDLVTIPATKIHLATSISKAELDKFFAVNKPWATETDRKRVNANSERVADAERDQDIEQTKATERTIEATVAVARETARTEKRKENIKAKRPVNEGVREAGQRASAKRVEALAKLRQGTRKVSVINLDDMAVADKDAGMKIHLKPMVYNGFIALEADVENADEKALKGLDFIHFGRYLYADFFYYADFEKFLDFVEETKKLEFDNATARRLEFIMDGFEQTGKMTFNARQALKADSDLKQFFLTRHRTAKDRKHIKAYPMVMPDRLRVMIDLETNPRAQAWVGVKIAGTRKWGKFQESDGMWITFASNVTSAKAKINRVLKEGYPIDNVKATVTELGKIKGTKRKSS